LNLTTADLITQLSFDGINWIGIVHRDDRRSVDMLASLSLRAIRSALAASGFREAGFRFHR